MSKKYLFSFAVSTKGSDNHALLQTSPTAELGCCVAQPHVRSANPSQEPVTSSATSAMRSIRLGVPKGEVMSCCLCTQFNPVQQLGLTYHRSGRVPVVKVNKTDGCDIVSMFKGLTTKETNL